VECAPLPSGERLGVRVRFSDLIQSRVGPNPHPPLRGTLSRRERGKKAL